ncbi:Polyadenylate-binding protein-interacting protein 2 [Willisornis vidua]|uniref:Polyadenylate-binding protein-interacting protein 2 n=1 Tax=Willisornis vidua TaxID=1566151 RepID=A0ABQ9D383_9PASS|nr:Polyadenylate-binding protein-interacting protein 2 [Willisornis vidua]
MKDPSRSSTSPSIISEDVIINGHSHEDDNPFAEYMWMENEEEFNRQASPPLLGHLCHLPAGGQCRGWQPGHDRPLERSAPAAAIEAPVRAQACNQTLELGKPCCNIEEELWEEEFIERCFQEMLEEEEHEWFIPARDLPQTMDQIQDQFNDLVISDSSSLEDLVVKSNLNPNAKEFVPGVKYLNI